MVVMIGHPTVAWHLNASKMETITIILDDDDEERETVYHYLILPHYSSLSGDLV